MRKSMKARRVGHRVWEVLSRSRKKLAHTVDLDVPSCSCEFHVFKHATCDHIRCAEAAEDMYQK